MATKPPKSQCGPDNRVLSELSIIMAGGGGGWHEIRFRELVGGGRKFVLKVHSGGGGGQKSILSYSPSNTHVNTTA